ncbi:hypothetical protein [Ereboglobus luteus]|uniref:Uncharacterized protein n=1 Tax=Ereboglobus luteus TaxID=1796921 RepID=A0A2U8E3G1_9BACT|nr:hypothetical protein [Ereboglobus luteus]AWI09417.1 hypothetical protein CKA38_09300 [Ereboglobus luteus]
MLTNAMNRYAGIPIHHAGISPARIVEFCFLWEKTAEILPVKMTQRLEFSIDHTQNTVIFAQIITFYYIIVSIFAI